MEDRLFKNTIAAYRDLMVTVLARSGVCGAYQKGMDWVSDLYVAGSRLCVEMADEYMENGSRVLDLGCGMGLISVFLTVTGHDVTGIDIDVGQVPSASSTACQAPWGSFEAELEHPSLLSEIWSALGEKYGIAFSVFDGKRIPFDTASCESVVAHAVHEHVDQSVLPGLIDEVARVLQSGGTFFVFRTPRKDSVLEKLARWMGMGAHELLADEEEVEQMVGSHGFTLEKSAVTDMLPAFPPWGMWAYNRLSPLLVRLDGALLRTRANRYAHHMALVFRKSATGSPT
jgi:SAM-dependent methyltransferase